MLTVPLFKVFYLTPLVLLLLQAVEENAAVLTLQPLDLLQSVDFNKEDYEEEEEQVDATSPVTVEIRVNASNK